MLLTSKSCIWAPSFVVNVSFYERECILFIVVNMSRKKHTNKTREIYQKLRLKNSQYWMCVRCVYDKIFRAPEVFSASFFVTFLKNRKSTVYFREWRVLRENWWSTFFWLIFFDILVIAFFHVCVKSCMNRNVKE